MSKYSPSICKAYWHESWELFSTDREAEGTNEMKFHSSILFYTALQHFMYFQQCKDLVVLFIFFLISCIFVLLKTWVLLIHNIRLPIKWYNLICQIFLWVRQHKCIPLFYPCIFTLICLGALSWQKDNSLGWTVFYYCLSLVLCNSIFCY